MSAITDLTDRVIDAHGGLERWNDFTSARLHLKKIGLLLEIKQQPAWSELQAAYFASYAIRGYFTVPFIFSELDFHCAELSPWQEDGETWRRLQVRFPDRVATHNLDQTFYIDANGLIRRNDYGSEITKGGWVAHYTSEHRTFDGIVVPTRRRVYTKGPDGYPVREQTIIAIDLDGISFS